MRKWNKGGRLILCVLLMSMLTGCQNATEQNGERSISNGRVYL